MLKRFKRLHVYIRFLIYSLFLIIGFYAFFLISLRIVQNQFVYEAENRTSVFASLTDLRVERRRQINENYEQLIELQLKAIAEKLVLSGEMQSLDDWIDIMERYDIHSISIANEEGLVYQATDEALLGHQSVLAIHYMSL